MIKKFLVGCVLVTALTHCVQPVKTVKIHPNCPEIPATTFEKVGLDAKAGALQFGKLVTVGELTVRSDPQIISGISQSVRDDQITDALICAARERGELKTDEQIAHAWKVARFYRTNPTPDKAMEFYKQNPFPVTPGSPDISQHSEGPNSPNIIGDKNSVVIMTPPDRPLGREPSDIQDEKIYIECEGKPIPQTTLSDRKVKGLAFSHRTPGSSVTATEFQSIGVPGGRTDWVVEGRAFECQITNYGTVPVLKMQITFGLSFLETVWLDSKGSFTHRFKFSEKWTSQIRKLDPWPAERFTFLMKNITNDWLEVTVPQFVELQILGESKKRSVPLSRPDDDPGHLGTYYRSKFLFPPADFAQQNRPENWPQRNANGVAK